MSVLTRRSEDDCELCFWIQQTHWNACLITDEAPWSQSNLPKSSFEIILIEDWLLIAWRCAVLELDLSIWLRHSVRSDKDIFHNNSQCNKRFENKEAHACFRIIQCLHYEFQATSSVLQHLLYYANRHCSSLVGYTNTILRFCMLNTWYRRSHYRLSSTSTDTFYYFYLSSPVMSITYVTTVTF
jgi:hypothetical protein